jgi:uncharacterized membrane protein YqhA
MLWGSRFMVLSAVISSLLLSLTLFVVTAIDVGSLVMHLGDYLSATIEVRKELKIEMEAHAVGAIDGFLLATILLIFSLKFQRQNTPNQVHLQKSLLATLQKM